MSDAWFVDERVNILRGSQAQDAIRARSDLRYLTEGEGIVRVPAERWTIAQTFERTGWMEKWRGLSDDRNIDHAREFNGYRSLAGRRFAHAIELGCGPFTNLRVIAEVAPLERVSLLDPLIESYLTLPTCRYNRQVLVSHSGRQRIAVGELFAGPIEDTPLDGRSYDLVAMLNVIEHCYDVGKIFDKILSITRPGSVLVFQDYTYDVEKSRRVLAEEYYEAGHPLMVGPGVLHRFMSEHFEMLYYSKVPEKPQEVACPREAAVYFIGVRR